jgi:CubicO group peptidase (beta-lactamase class C family)
MSESINRRSFLRAAGTAVAATGVGAALPFDAGAHAASTARAAMSPTSTLAASLRERIAPLAERHRLVGLGLAVARGAEGEALGFGLASVPFDVPVTPDTLFHVASVGKHFTAAAVLQLAGHGRLRLADPIGRHLKDVPDAWAARSIASLLHHTSGIPDYEGDDFDDTKPHTRAEVIAAAAAKPMLFDEGRTWSYSNMNYMLLGWLVEATSGLTFTEYLTNNVLRRGGLVDSRVDAAEELVRGRAEPYTWHASSGTFRHASRMDNAYSGYPDGPVLLTAADSLRWERALASHTVLDADQWRTMLEPARLSSGLSAPYACAWFVESVRGRAIHSHTGGLPGFTAFYLRMPESGVAVMVLTNVRIFGSRVQRYLGWVAAEAAAPGSTMLSLPPGRDDRPDLTLAAREMLLRGDRPANRDALAPELLTIVEGPLGDRGLTNRPIALAGEPTRFEFVEQRRFGPATLRRYRLIYPDLVEHVVFGYTPAGKIYWIFPD